MAPDYPILLVGEDSVILFGRGGKADLTLRWDAPDFEARLSAAFRDSGGKVVLLFNDNGHTYRREDNLTVEEGLKRLEENFAKMKVRGALAFRRARAANAQLGRYDYLFIGLENSLRHNLLGKVLDDAGVGVVGCSVLPVESTALVAALSEKVRSKSKPKGRWAMIAGLHQTGGMRQVIIRDGELALTRIHPVNAASPAALAQVTVEELQASINYLRRFGYKDTDGMDIMIICSAADKKLYSTYVLKGATLHALTVQEALAQLGLATASPETRYADALYAAWTERTEKLALHLSIPAVKRDTAGH
jgi:hypothetical protein